MQKKKKNCKKEKHYHVRTANTNYSSANVTNLYTSSQHFMQHVCPGLHDLDVSGSAVRALAIIYGVNEAVSELLPGSQQAWFHKADHAMICR